MVTLKAALANSANVGDIVGTGNFTGKKVGAFAFLASSESTETVVAGTYYPIAGTFTNSPSECFIEAVTYTPGIKYNCGLTQYFEIDWHASVRAEVANTTLHCGVMKNGELVVSSKVGTFAKNADQPYALSGTTVIELAEDDEVQLVCESDQATKDLTFIHFTTTLSEFFD